MKKINVRFEISEEKDVIDVVVAASEKDDQVCTLMNRVRDPLAGSLAVYDSTTTMKTIPESSIISISTDGKRLAVRAESGTFELRMSLKDARKTLHPEMFMQISRFEIINLNKVKRFSFPFTGTLQIEMQDGTKTWASRRYIAEIKNRLIGKDTGK